MFRLTTETGTPITTFDPAAYPGGAKGALQVASHAARLYARDTAPCLLSGAGPLRRYSRVYERRSLVRPYRVQGECGHWMFPGAGSRCRECFREQGQSDRQKAAVAAANRKRGK